ncbi:hypothetical protein [uncultured Muriicola sp.]|uniref:hypothetical protein n=1 Tax=uncultured Muriicola sp. TaxID=1583102 RepID=UPI00260AF06B|nr:hypothetical protein [uncultured Muriicola sp.]
MPTACKPAFREVRITYPHKRWTFYLQRGAQRITSVTSNPVLFKASPACLSSVRDFGRLAGLSAVGKASRFVSNIMRSEMNPVCFLKEVLSMANGWSSFEIPTQTSN